MIVFVTRDVLITTCISCIIGLGQMVGAVTQTPAQNTEILKLELSPNPALHSLLFYSVLENNRITSADLTFPNRNWSVPVLVLSLLSPVCQQTRDLCFSLDSQREGFITCKDSRRLSLMMMMLTSQTTLDTDTGITAE